MKKALKVIWLVAILAFFLPFLTVSCQNEKIGSLSGFNFVTGKSLGGERVGANFGIILVFLLSIAALIVVFQQTKENLLIPAVIGVINTILLFNFQSKAKAKLAESYLRGEFKIGFYLALLCAIASAAICIYLLVNKNNTAKIDINRNTDNHTGSNS
jgi:hypothetical protein